MYGAWEFINPISFISVRWTMIFDFSKEVKTATSERERKEAMIDRIIRPEVEEAIREAGLNPSYFMVNKASEQEFF